MQAHTCINRCKYICLYVCLFGFIFCCWFSNKNILIFRFQIFLALSYFCIFVFGEFVSIVLGWFFLLVVAETNETKNFNFNFLFCVLVLVVVATVQAINWLLPARGKEKEERSNNRRESLIPLSITLTFFLA